MTRALLRNARAYWRQLDTASRIGIVLFEVAWLAQMYILARLFFG